MTNKIMTHFNTEPDDNNAPELISIKVSETITDAAIGKFLDEISSGKEYYMCFMASDNDMDITKAVCSYKSGNKRISERTIPVTGQDTVSAMFLGAFIAPDAGQWEATVYMIDSKGNKSNTVVSTILVR
jgi:hypothetical protein